MRCRNQKRKHSSNSFLKRSTRLGALLLLYPASTSVVAFSTVSSNNRATQPQGALLRQKINENKVEAGTRNLACFVSKSPLPPPPPPSSQSSQQSSLDCRNLATDQKKNKNVKTNSNQNKKLLGSSKNDRMPDVNDIVAEMGLTPVSTGKAPLKNQSNIAASHGRKNKPKKSDPTNTNNHHQQATTISLQTQLDYARNGHAVLRNYLDPSKLKVVREDLLTLGKKQELKAWRQKVEVAAGSVHAANKCRTVQDCQRELDQLLQVPPGSSSQLPFLQYFNSWRQLATVKNMALELAETAAVLLDVPRLRLYQDSFFWKRANDGPTPWHTDARMAPFDSSDMITLWIPLHDIPRHGSALQFVSKSHADFALPFWNPYRQDADDEDDRNNTYNNPWNRLDERYQNNKIVNYMPMTMGDLTAHSGFTLHCADSQAVQDENNIESNDRLALAISYVDARAPIRKGVLMKGDHGDDEDQWSYADWVKEVSPGQPFEHPLVPIIWPRE